MSRLIIHAINIHQGGGRSLLVSLFSVLNQTSVVLIDERIDPLPDLDPNIQIIRVAPNIPDRIKAEYRLKSLCREGDTLLCFGNLPPLFPNLAKVFVYLQNRYLTSYCSLTGLGWASKIRIHIERLWLRFCVRNACILVQTESTAAEVRNILGLKCQIMPFFPDSNFLENPKAVQNVKYDYIYVASGYPHKNHRKLVEAWIILAEQNIRPTLCLTLDSEGDASLWSWVEEKIDMHGLRIVNKPCDSEKMALLYARSNALIYPSFFESFGLPLLEAFQAGLPIIATERDYVRDVVQPLDSFDPESALSIARAVLRHQGMMADPKMPVSAVDFLKQLSEL